MKTDLLNKNLMDDFSSFSDEYSNITSNRCDRIKRRYEKAVDKGKDNKAAKKLAKLLRKCEGLIDMPKSKAQKEVAAIEKEAEVVEIITPDIPSTEKTPDMGVTEKADVMPDESYNSEKKILGMKKKVAVPVFIVSGLAVTTVTFFLIRKMVKK